MKPLITNSPKGINALKLTAVRVYFLFADVLIAIARAVLFKKNEAPSKILLFRTGSLGDSICATPSILSIRRSFPNAKLVLLTNAGGDNLVSLPQLLPRRAYDEVVDYHGQKLFGIAPALRKGNFDLVIELPQYQGSLFRQLRNMLFFRLVLKIPSGFGWDAASCKFFRRTQEKHLRYPNERDRLLAVLKKNKLPVLLPDQFQLQTDERDFQVVEKLYATHLRATHKPCISMVIGAKRPQNRWPAAYFLELIHHYKADYNILLIGGPEDIPLARTFQHLEGVYSFCGKLTPVQSYLMLRKSAVVISNDTGPMHLAYAAGVPLVAIFSSRDFPHRWFPPDTPSNTVLRNDNVPCSVCFTETCRNNICMQGISPQTVIGAVDAVVKTLSEAG